ncbi:MAG TPA: hypothetical protein VGI40_16170 [Pirellulaceae bacterium]|jgi:hypothetical protein
MLRFTIRDLLWLMVVVGLAVAVGVERYRSARLRSQLNASELRVQDEEFRFVELALEWQAHHPKTFTIKDGKIEIDTDTSFSSHTLTSGEVRLLQIHERNLRSIWPNR